MSLVSDRYVFPDMLSDCSSCFGFSFCFCDLRGRRIPELHTGILEAILSESGPELCLQFDLVGGPQAGLVFHFLEKVSDAIVLLVHRFPYFK